MSVNLLFTPNNFNLASQSLVATSPLQLAVLTTTQMNAVASPSAGMLIYNTTVPALYYFNGSAWVAVSHP